MVALGHARPGRAERTEDGCLQGSPMVRRPHEPARRAPVDGDEGTRWRDDLDRRGAEPMTGLRARMEASAATLKAAQ
jgi:hypothetical protein